MDFRLRAGARAEVLALSQNFRLRAARNSEVGPREKVKAFRALRHGQNFGALEALFKGMGAALRKHAHATSARLGAHHKRMGAAL